MHVATLCKKFRLSGNHAIIRLYRVSDHDPWALFPGESLDEFYAEIAILEGR